MAGLMQIQAVKIAALLGLLQMVQMPFLSKAVNGEISMKMAMAIIGPIGQSIPLVKIGQSDSG